MRMSGSSLPCRCSTGAAHDIISQLYETSDSQTICGKLHGKLHARRLGHTLGGGAVHCEEWSV